MKKDHRIFPVVMDDDVIQSLRLVALQKRTSASAIIRDLIKDYLTKVNDDTVEQQK